MTDVVINFARTAATAVADQVAAHPTIATAVAGATAAALVGTQLLAIKKASDNAARLAAQAPNVVHLYTFPRPSFVVGVGAPGVKVEAFLRMHKIPFVQHFTTDPSGSPTGRVPYIELNGKAVAESQFILEHLMEAFKIDEQLSPLQTARGIALRRIVESAQLHHGRVMIVDNPNVMVGIFGDFVPAFMPTAAIRYIIGGFRQKQIAMLNAHGQGDLTDARYRGELLHDLQALEALLAENEFAVGNAPTHYDATVWAYLLVLRALAPKIQAASAAPIALLTFVTESKVIGAYVAKLEKKYFSDAAEIIAKSNASRLADQEFLQ
jgi:glutathione S-transferase